MSNRMNALLGVFETTDFLIPLVLDDLTDEEARTRARGEEGPSIAWTVGHLLHYRHLAMSVVGSANDDPYAERFGKQGATAGDDYPTLAELRDAWGRVGDAFHAAMQRVSEEVLDSGTGSMGHDEETVQDRLSFFAFHEGYHLGALGALRKQLGHAGPAEKVIALMEQNA